MVFIMKAQETMRLLDVSRPTLGKYVKIGKIRAERKPNGHLDFNDEDVRKLYGKGIQRMTYIYARVSTPKQKQSTVDLLKQFCFSKGYNVSGVFTDVAGGISLIAMLHCYSMKLYSGRRIAKIKKALEEDCDETDKPEKQDKT